MKYVRDLTGRFHQRPLFEREELDAICERALIDHLSECDTRLEYPVSTELLQTLIEAHAGKLDLFADLSGEGDDVEGVTDFLKGQKPRVRISSDLSNDVRREVRLRTTLGHEFGHVHLHDALFQAHVSAPDLFGDRTVGARQSPKSVATQESLARCKRETIVGARDTDWMEWQAGYVCGALLMPRKELRGIVHAAMRKAGQIDELEIGSELGRALVAEVAQRFFVSAEAARVRLQVLGLAVTKRVERSVFE
ncbi:MAG: ImmA/IrrE family metallo-endopeptidase [Gemmatimonadetes bacterium]|nr:ImmA/IrrE family metallo-endopeptidase [Gemmatimonadota bacterium]